MDEEEKKERDEENRSHFLEELCKTNMACLCHISLSSIIFTLPHCTTVGVTVLALILVELQAKVCTALKCLWPNSQKKKKTSSLR